MYKVGKYKYKSLKDYQNKLILVYSMFFVCMFLLFILKQNIQILLFYFAIIIDIVMQIHLILRYLHSNKKINYIFNEY
ncbi:MAG: hypothetical protein ACOC16_00145 [Nanoarchaeota archaeon]